MSAFSKDIIEIIYALLPGFLAAWVFYGLTAHPKKDPFERVVQALIFTVIVRTLTAIVRWLLLRIGHVVSLGVWTEDVALGWSLILASVFGLLIAGLANNNTVHGILGDRCWNFMKRPNDAKDTDWVWTKRTAFPSEWFSAFNHDKRYVILHLEGERRLYGWPMEWPDQSESGHFVIADAAWILDNNEKVPLYLVDRMLVPVTKVGLVEFMLRPEEYMATEGDIQAAESKLVKLQESKGK